VHSRTGEGVENSSLWSRQTGTDQHYAKPTLLRRLGAGISQRQHLFQLPQTTGSAVPTCDFSDRLEPHTGGPHECIGSCDRLGQTAAAA
jgi:hypothetical protein